MPILEEEILVSYLYCGECCEAWFPDRDAPIAYYKEDALKKAGKAAGWTVDGPDRWRCPKCSAPTIPFTEDGVTYLGG